MSIYRLLLFIEYLPEPTEEIYPQVVCHFSITVTQLRKCHQEVVGLQIDNTIILINSSSKMNM